MSEYDEQALNFLRESRTMIKIIKAEHQEPSPWSKGTISGYKYKVTLTRDRGAYTFDFWGSIHDRQTGKTPTKYDVLACLDVYDGSLDEFVSEFGYDDMDMKISDVIKTYNAVIDQTLQLKQLFTPAQLDQLMEIK